MSSPSKHIMLLAGESSGDQHGAEMAKHLLNLEPNVKLTGMGSHAMKKVGVDLVFDSASIAVVGIVEIAKHWGDIKRAMSRVKNHLSEQKPNLLVCIDYPEFNLKMARFAKSLGIKVLFYISPQVWAWRPKRVVKIGHSIDHMAVIFPFEVEFYSKHNIPVTYVGHPLVDKIKVKDDDSKKNDSERKRVGIFPGSRLSEITRTLPTMLESATLLSNSDENIEFVLPVAAGLDQSLIKSYITDKSLKINLAKDDLYSLIHSCDAIMSCSGTVTLEIALHNTPLCVIYKMSWVSHQIMKRLMIIKHFCLVNIVAKRLIVKEFLQEKANAKNISQEIQQILDNTDYRKEMQKGLKEVKQKLGEGGGSKQIAELALTLI